MEFFGKTWLLWLALSLIVVGFVTLKAGMLSVGPLLLVAGYCVGMPLFIWRAFRKSVGDGSAGSQTVSSESVGE